MYASWHVVVGMHQCSLSLGPQPQGLQGHRLPCQRRREPGGPLSAGTFPPETPRRPHAPAGNGAPLA